MNIVYKMEKIKKISLNFFILSIFLQSCSFIKVDSFGIALSTTILILIFILNIKNFKISTTENLIFSIINIILLINMLVSENFSVMKLLRINMIVFDVIITKFFICKYNYEEIKSVVTKYIWLISIYGIYCYIADLYELPKIMNIFINNPSYSDFSKNLYFNYGGWTGEARVYSTFYEPSIYSVFMILCMCFINVSSMKMLKKSILTLIILFNILVTQSRTGMAILGYIICIYIIYTVSYKLYLSIEKVLIIAFPLINIFILNFVNTYIFNDISSEGRSGAPMHFLKSVFTNTKSFIFGKGLEYKESFLVKDGGSYVYEKIPHNSYVDFLYTGGIVYLILFILIAFLTIRMIKNIKYRMIIIPSIIFSLGFEQYIYVESIIIFITVLIIFSIKKEEKEIYWEKYNENRNKYIMAKA